MYPFFPAACKIFSLSLVWRNLILLNFGLVLFLVLKIHWDCWGGDVYSFHQMLEMFQPLLHQILFLFSLPFFLLRIPGTSVWGHLMMSHSSPILCSVFYSLFSVCSVSDSFYYWFQVYWSFLSCCLICCWSHSVSCSFHTLSFPSLEVDYCLFYILSLFDFLNIWNPVIITVTMSLSTHSNIWVSFDWLIDHLTVIIISYFFACLIIFLLDSRHFYLGARYCCIPINVLELCLRCS